MKKATISQTKNQLSALLDAVRHGETVLIVDRDQPVARLEPVAAGSGQGDDLLARLQRKGLISRGTGKQAQRILREAPPVLRRGVSAVAALVAERSEGR